MNIIKWLSIAALVGMIVLSRSCSPGAKKEIEPRDHQIIAGRDEGQGRQSVYRMKVPVNWIRHDPLPEETLVDTTKALCEYIIMDNAGMIRITIHNFPSAQIADRIPPAAQITRWQQQFESLDTLKSITTPQSFSGYSGLLFWGEGIIKSNETAVMGWSLQLAPEHYYKLLYGPKAEEFLYNQMRGDVTIKAVGPTALMHKHKRSIMDAARTFELIREIPAHS